MKYKPLLLIGLSSLFFLCVGFSVSLKAERRIVDYIQIIVNDRIATKNEIEEAAYTLAMQSQQGRRPRRPTSEELTVLKEQVTEGIIQDFLLLDRAEQLKMETTDEEVEEQLDNIVYSNPQVLKVYSRDELKEQVSNDLLRRRVIAQEVESKIHIEDAEIEHFCQQTKGGQRELGVAQILLRGDRQDVEPQLEVIRKKWEEGESFFKLAKQYSQDPKATENEGRLGVFKKGQLLAEIDQVAFNMEEGTISAAIETQYGFHILYIYEERSGSAAQCQELTAEERDRYFNQLYQQNREKILSEYLLKLRQSAQVIVKQAGEVRNRD